MPKTRKVFMRQLNLKKEIALNGLKRENALAVKIALTSTRLKDVESEKEKARAKVKTVAETDPNLGADLLLLERVAGIDPQAPVDVLKKGETLVPFGENLRQVKLTVNPAHTF